MKTVKLSARLQALADMVSEDRIVCDVGCDHGKLAYNLLKSQVVDYVYISDISKSSLQKAIDLLTRNNMNFTAICCDGLSKYDGVELDECIIAGMGGEEIIKIISNSKAKVNSYILSPQHNIIETKKFILGLDYKITFDIIIKDKDKFYNIIKCEKSQIKQKYTELDLYFGKDSFINKSSDIDEFIDFEINKNVELIKLVNKDKVSKIRSYLDLLYKAKKERESYE